ncbi:EamA family transporter [Chloroflexi bacterium TSY]|nr:EamA family transporter [Chloroflexi bacterium TSY]
MNFRSIPFILLVGLLFGLSIVVSRFAIDQFAPLPFVGLRLTIASIAFASLYLFLHRSICSCVSDFRFPGI